VTRGSLQTEFVERTPGNNASAEPSTKNVIETLRFCAFAPPSSSLDRLCRGFSLEHDLTSFSVGRLPLFGAGPLRTRAVRVVS